MKGEVVVATAVPAVTRRRSSARKHHLPAVPTDSYATGRLRSETDTERLRAEALCARHPEFERLGHEPLLQLADTYLDDEDHALRAELPLGAVGYHRQESDDVAPPWSDEGFVSAQFVVFGAGLALLVLGLFLQPTAVEHWQFVSTAAIVLGAAAMGLSFGEGDGGRS